MFHLYAARSSHRLAAFFSLSAISKHRLEHYSHLLYSTTTGSSQKDKSSPMSSHDTFVLSKQEPPENDVSLTESGSNRISSRLSDIHFANTLTSTLVPDAHTPGDPFIPPKEDNKFSHVPRQVPKAHFSYVRPESCPDPVLLSFNRQLGNEMGWNSDSFLSDPEGRNELTQLLSGTKLFSKSNSWSLAYGGHQFGSWAGQLGDGRAISLGELQVVDHPSSGDSQSLPRRYELQLKGAGLTPYSRFADGYAVLRSSIREYLCAEAMHVLGAPTSRSLSLIGSSRPVYREETETGAIVCRVAPTWIRFGNFELFFARDDFENMEKLIHYTISNHFPHLYDQQTTSSTALSAKIENHLFVRWLRDVCRKTARMIAHWQAIGFCHGVMNTDNFSILGLTIDYGPFQFMDIYESDYICNHSDETSRYAFNEQPRVAMWNVSRLFSVIHPLISGVFKEDGSEDTVVEILTKIILSFPQTWESDYTILMRRKLGISFQPLQGDAVMSDYDHDMTQLIRPLLQLLEEAELDYTHFFRTLSRVSLIPEELDDETLDKKLLDSSMLPSRSEKWPDIRSRFREWYKSYRSRIVTDAVYTQEQDTKRQAEMLGINPKYILRNHLVNDVIDDVKKGDIRSLDTYFKLLQNPFAEGSPEEEVRFAGPVPAFCRGMKCSCSS